MVEIVKLELVIHYIYLIHVCIYYIYYKLIVNESWDVIINTSFVPLHYHSMLNVMNNLYIIGSSYYESENKIYKMDIEINFKVLLLLLFCCLFYFIAFLESKI